MDAAEARAIVDRRVSQLREQTYEELRDTWLSKADSEDYTGADGTWYQLEIQALWDDKTTRTLRLFVDIDAEGWRGLGSSFVVAPDGSFFG